MNSVHVFDIFVKELMMNLKIIYKIDYAIILFIKLSSA